MIIYIYDLRVRSESYRGARSEPYLLHRYIKYVYNDNDNDNDNDKNI